MDLDVGAGERELLPREVDGGAGRVGRVREDPPRFGTVDLDKRLLEVPAALEVEERGDEREPGDGRPASEDDEVDRPAATLGMRGEVGVVCGPPGVEGVDA